MKSLLHRLLLCLAVVATAVAASEEEALLQELATRLQFHHGLAGQFHQEKHLHFMNRPLVSTGEFSVSRTDGLTWQVQEPVSSLMTVQGREVRLDGIPVRDQGVGQLIAEIMLGFMDGDMTALARSFSVTGDTSGDVWRVSLEPDTVLMRSVLQRIALSGDSYLEQIEVIENDTGSTLIRFDQVREMQAADAGQP
jgi:hypothetical protein